MAAAAAARFGLEPAEVLVLSTGVIGVPLPMGRIREGIGRLDPSERGGDEFARAIMTTDTVPKAAALEYTDGGETVRVGGAAKGSGMIHPDMATLLAVVTTDAAAEPAFLQAALGRAADRSFNLISVDGDTSTNDTLLLLANGAAGGATIGEGSAGADAFEAALTAVCIDLARAVARDGEGARSLVEVAVTGATDDAAARRIARSIASSTLVKAAVFGGDPNWGRVLCAAGYAGPELEVERATLHLGEICLFRLGVPQHYDRPEATALLKQPDVRFVLDLGLGPGNGVAWGCDLSYEYVKINAEYTT
jgi:glutamate N-acetyltransferase/amino-acid N-acetyltransferase